MTGIGHNTPPPVEAYGMAIDDLYSEGRNFLDGAPVQTEADATAIGVLLDRIRTVRKDADAQRKVEKAPHDEAAKAVQAAWSPLLEKCDRMSSAAKAALTPYQVRLEAEQRAEADKARAIAEQAQRDAQAALANAPAADLSAREQAEQLLKDAGRAAKSAARIDRWRPLVATEGRSIGLRTSYRAELTDPAAALRHYREAQPDALKAWLAEQAQRDVRNGARAIPGFDVIEERKAA